MRRWARCAPPAFGRRRKHGQTGIHRIGHGNRDRSGRPASFRGENDAGRLCCSEIGCVPCISLHFILSPTSLLSSFPVQVSIRFVTSYQNSCATYGNDCAQPLKWLCKVLGTVVPLRWHSRAKGVAQACQRGGTSKAYLQRGSYQVVKLE